MPLKFHRLVQHDLNVVLNYYEAEGGPRLADRFFAEVEALVRAIEQTPGRFHLVSAGLRRANLKSFSYHFLFRVSGKEVWILVLRHHKRRPTYGTERF